MVLVTECDDKVPKRRYDDVRNQGWQPHLRLSDSPVLLGGPHGDPVRERTVGEKTDNSADQECKVEEADRLAVEVIRRRPEGVELGEVDGQEDRSGPRHIEGCELDNGIRKQLPRRPERVQQRLPIATVQSPEFELSLGRAASAQEQVCRRVRVALFILALLGLSLFLGRRAVGIGGVKIRLDLGRLPVTLPFGLGEKEDKKHKGESK